MMKRCLPMLTAVLVGSATLVGPSATTVFARGSRPAWAGAPRHDHDQDNRGQRKKRERERGRFDDHDRREAREYYEHHRDDRGFRERDWISRDDDERLRDGYVLDRGLRRRCRPLPVVLLREMPPCPRGYRYYLLGGNVVLVDDGYRVRDFIHLDINFR